MEAGCNDVTELMIVDIQNTSLSFFKQLNLYFNETLNQVIPITLDEWLEIGNTLNKVDWLDVLQWNLNFVVLVLHNHRLFILRLRIEIRCIIFKDLMNRILIFSDVLYLSMIWRIDVHFYIRLFKKYYIILYF